MDFFGRERKKTEREARALAQTLKRECPSWVSEGPADQASPQISHIVEWLSRVDQEFKKVRESHPQYEALTDQERRSLVKEVTAAWGARIRTLVEERRASFEKRVAPQEFWPLVMAVKGWMDTFITDHARIANIRNCKECQAFERASLELLRHEPNSTPVDFQGCMQECDRHLKDMDAIDAGEKSHEYLDTLRRLILGLHQADTRLEGMKNTVGVLRRDWESFLRATFSLAGIFQSVSLRASILATAGELMGSTATPVSAVPPDIATRIQDDIARNLSSISSPLAEADRLVRPIVGGDADQVAEGMALLRARNLPTNIPNRILDEVGRNWVVQGYELSNQALIMRGGALMMPHWPSDPELVPPSTSRVLRLAHSISERPRGINKSWVNSFPLHEQVSPEEYALRIASIIEKGLDPSDREDSQFSDPRLKDLQEVFVFSEEDFIRSGHPGYGFAYVTFEIGDDWALWSGRHDQERRCTEYFILTHVPVKRDFTVVLDKRGLIQNRGRMSFMETSATSSRKRQNLTGEAYCLCVERVLSNAHIPFQTV